MNEYRVVEREGCTLIFGALTARSLQAFAAMGQEGDVLDTSLARMAGASFAFGSAADCAALRTKLAPEAVAQQASLHQDLPPAAARWLGAGERGASSNAIFHAVTGVETGATTEWPYDPADLARCRLLLEAVPEFNAPFRARMPALNPQWAGLVAAWDSLCATMDREAPRWRAGEGRCPETFTAMRKILDAARASDASIRSAG